MVATGIGWNRTRLLLKTASNFGLKKYSLYLKKWFSVQRLSLFEVNWLSSLYRGKVSYMEYAEYGTFGF